MKTCFIINFWADTKDKVEIIKRSISQIKKLGNDVIYTSLYPIDSEIADITDYSIFLNQNDLITMEDILRIEEIDVKSTYSFQSSDGNIRWESIPLNSKNVIFSVYYQFVSTLKFLKKLNYTHFHYLVGDTVVSDDDLGIFKQIENSVKLTNTKSFFTDIQKMQFYGYGSNYWYGEIDFFINKFENFKTKHQFLEDQVKKYKVSNKEICFESFLKNVFGEDENVLVRIANENTNSMDFLTNSEFDIIQTYNSKTSYSLIPNQESFDLYIISKENSVYEIEIDGDNQTVELGIGNFYSYRIYKNNFLLKICKNNTEIFEINVDDKIYQKLKKSSYYY